MPSCCSDSSEKEVTGNCYVGEAHPDRLLRLTLSSVLRRTAQLERKLEDLVSLLAAKELQSTPIDSTQRPAEATSGNNASPLTPLGTFSNASIASDLNASVSEADELLTHFKTHFVRDFPFIVIPVNKSASELRQERPYLYEAILMVATYREPTRQGAMANELLQNLTARIILNGESSLDLLQALLVFAAWQHLYHTPRQRIAGILHMAMGLVCDLGLRHPQPSEAQEIITYQMNRAAEMPLNGGVRTPDEMRAYLGCFMLASMVSLCLKLADGLRYSPFVDDCCDFLQSHVEYASDQLLVARVRLQCIVDRMHEAFSNRYATLNPMSTPVGLHVNLFRGELAAFKASLPIDIQQDYHFAMHYHDAEIHLYEQSMHKSSATSYGSYSIQQVDMLHSCLIACQLWFQIILTISSQNFVTLSMHDFGRMSHAISTLFKLSILEVPGWDQEHVRRTVDISVILEQLVRRLDSALEPTETHPTSNSNDAFNQGARRLERFKDWFSSKFTTLDSGQQNKSQGMFTASELDAFNASGHLSFMDDAFWLEITGGDIMS